MEDNICTVCAQNKLISELERITQVCDDCSDDFERGSEQDFDETMFAYELSADLEDG